jgi:hypothetical protein
MRPTVVMAAAIASGESLNKSRERVSMDPSILGLSILFVHGQFALVSKDRQLFNANVLCRFPDRIDNLAIA